MKNESHNYYTPSEISKMAIDKALAEAFEMNDNRKLSHDEAWDMALNEIHYSTSRLSESDAFDDYKNMVSFRKLPAIPAHLLCLAEMEMRAR